MKRLYTIGRPWFISLLLLLLGLRVNAQQQTLMIDDANFASQATYGAGSDIAVLFKTTGCYNVNNTFRLILSNSTGGFDNGTIVVGSYNSDFATFINGIIPATVASGNNYRLLLTASDPNLRDTTTFFAISNTVAPRARINASASSRILRADYAYGFCASPSAAQNLSLNDVSTSGASTIGTLKNEITGVTTATQQSAGSSYNIFLDRFYYTYLVKAELNGVVASRAYQLVNSRNRITLGVDGEQSGCLPRELEFQVGIDAQFGGISENYPGATYTVSWGDNTSTTYRYCDLMARNGRISHLYNNTSCNLPGVSYNITITMDQPWTNSSVCDRPQVTTRAKISKKPTAYFQLPETACLNSQVLIRNVSDAGQAAFGTSCVSRADFFWYVNGVLVQTNIDRTSAQANLNYRFTQPGMNIVKLVVDNHACAVSDSTDTICIEPTPVVRYKVNNADTVNGCTPFQFALNNQSNPFYCAPPTYFFDVFNRSNNSLVATNSGVYTIDWSSGGATPNFQFNTPGSYYIRIRHINACGTGADTIFVNAIGGSSITLPSDKAYCNTRTINFGTDTAHRPIFNGITGVPAFEWIVSGGAFTYLNGTNANSMYPQIRFENATTYEVVVRFNNNCGISTDTQIIRFDPALSMVLHKTNDTICYTNNLINYTAAINVSSYDSIRWMSTGTGIFSNPNGTITNYTLSDTDRNLSSFLVIAAAYPQQGSTCSIARDTIRVVVTPHNFGIDSTRIICSGTAFQYIPRASVTGVTFNYTASVISGNATGFTANGSGTINNTLTNTNANSNAIVAYRYRTFYRGCEGDSFTVYVHVNARPNARTTHLVDTVCSGQQVGLQLLSGLPNTRYTWTATATGGNIQGFTQQATPIVLNAVPDVVSNVHTVTGRLIYSFTASNGSCTGNTWRDTIFIKPGVSAANAGADQYLCAATATVLNANTPVLGNGLWRQIDGPAVNIEQPNNATTNITNIAADTVVTMVWQISDASSCLPSVDTIRIFNRPTTTIAKLGDDTTYCNITNGSVVRIDLRNSFTVRAYENVQWQVLQSPAGATVQPIAQQGNEISFNVNRVGIYRFALSINNGACATTFDTIQVALYGSVTRGNIIFNNQVCGNITTVVRAQQYVGTIQSWQIFADGIWTTIGNHTADTLLVSTTTSDSLIRVRYIIAASGLCGGTDTSLVATIRVIPASEGGFITASIDTICVANTPVFLTVNARVGNIIRWERSIDNGTTWQAINSTQSTISVNNITATTRFRVVVQSSNCAIAYSSIKPVVLLSPIANNVLQAPTAICESAPQLQVTGSTPTGSDGMYYYQWLISYDGVQFDTIVGATSINYTSDSILQNAWIKRIIRTNTCDALSESNVVQIVVRPQALAAFRIISTQTCAPFMLAPNMVEATLYPTRNSNYQWFINGVSIGTGNIFPGYYVAAGTDSVAITLKAISLYGCANDSVTYVIRTSTPPQPSFTVSDTSGCVPLQVSFNNTTQHITGIQYFWNFGNGITSVQAQPGSILYQLHPNGGDTAYTVQLMAITACDTVTATKIIRLNGRPRASFIPVRTTGCSPFTVELSNNTHGTNNTYTWTFGDGSTPFITNSLQQVQHTYITGVQTTYPIQLVATNQCGSDTTSYNLVVSPNNIQLNLTVNGNELTGCAPHSVRFINASHNANSFTWNFNDGNTAVTFNNDDTVVHSFLQAGTYNVSVRAVNSCSDTTIARTIVVYGKPSAQFTLSNNNVCIGDTITTATNTQAVSTVWRWSNTTSNLRTPAITFSTSGTHQVQLIAANAYPSGVICADTVVRNVQVVTLRSGNIQVNDSVSNCAPFQLQYANATLAAAGTTQWLLNSNLINANTSGTHTIQNNGSYWLQMIHTTNGGCTYKDSIRIRLQATTGTWTYQSGTICNNTPVRFNAQTNGADSIRWYFGDGNVQTTTQATVFHTYVNAGHYVPHAMLIKNGVACNVQLIGSDTIKVQRIQAAFRTVLQQQCGNTQVNFYDSTITSNHLSQIRWSLGNGVQATGVTTTTNYTTTNNYTIRMVVTTAEGCTDSITRTIAVPVMPIPQAQIVLDTTGCINQTISFAGTANSLAPITLQQWQFSNGFTSNAASGQIRFATAGTYQAMYIAGTGNGCADTAYANIRIQSVPNVVANSVDVICRGNTVVLQAIGAERYTWSPAIELACDTCATTRATPTISRQYIVSGRMNGSSCIGRDTINITVVQPQQIQVAAFDTICVGQNTRLLASGADAYQWWPLHGLDNATVATPIAQPAITTQYRVIGRDAYSCFSDTGYVTVVVGQQPMIDLGPDKQAASGTKIPLTSSVVNGPIAQWVWGGNATSDLSCTTCAVPTLTVRTNASYTVRATTIYGCVATDTLQVKAFCTDAQVYIPNAFTPDGDGQNDVLMVRGSGIKLVKSFRIFNRWGQVVFERANFQANDVAQAWDGKLKGIPAPTDVYVYTCEVVCDNDTPFSYKGNITIIR